MKRLRNQPGSGVAGALLIVGVAILAVFGGIAYQYQRRVSAQSDQSLKRLSIAEWGTEVLLPSGISDAYFVASTSTYDPATGEPNTMWVGLTSLDGKGCSASRFNAEGTSRPVGALIRVAPTEVDPVSGVLYKEKHPEGVVIGDYYYVYIPWKNKDCATKASLDAVDSAFKNAAKSLTKKATATTPNKPEGSR